MKANAPEKIYLSENPCRNELEDVWFNNRSSKSDIEYTRTNAFVEKAAKWVSMNFDKIGEHYYEYVMAGTEYNPEQFIEKFKNYIK